MCVGEKFSIRFRRYDTTRLRLMDGHLYSLLFTIQLRSDGQRQRSAGKRVRLFAAGSAEQLNHLVIDDAAASGIALPARRTDHLRGIFRLVFFFSRNLRRARQTTCHLTEKKRPYMCTVYTYGLTRVYRRVI